MISLFQNAMTKAVLLLRKDANNAILSDLLSNFMNVTKWSFFPNFQVILDVQQFTPEEITVKAANNSVVVEGKHEEKRDEHGFISRQFSRRYLLPQGYDVVDLTSSLSSDGVLTITAPKKQLPGDGERIIPILKTGPAKSISVTEEPSYTAYRPHEQNVPIVTSP